LLKSGLYFLRDWGKLRLAMRREDSSLQPYLYRTPLGVASANPCSPNGGDGGRLRSLDPGQYEMVSPLNRRFNFFYKILRFLSH